ncbi:hypothetical protein COP2_008886 [Malus domestica]
MGLGRKIDPEAGRCRRTDGKKWRCSKEAFPDLKYCKKHMHGGNTGPDLGLGFNPGPVTLVSNFFSHGGDDCKFFS